MKYIFKIIWHIAMKPILALLLSISYYSFIALAFIVVFVWSLNFYEASKASKIFWCAEDELNRDGDKYWYYKTPIDQMYGRKKWTTRSYDHLF